MSYELNSRGKYYCPHLGTACDFYLQNNLSSSVIIWTLKNKLPFDSPYFYSDSQSIHISHSQAHQRDIWTFNSTGQPTKKGLDVYLSLIKKNYILSS